MRLVPLAGVMLGLAGCATSTGGLSLGPAKVATLEVQKPSPEASPASKEIPCQIQMIDGVMVGRSDTLKPGHHRLVVALGQQEGEHTGDVDLIIPAAKDYRLKAEREDDTFTLSLVETETSTTVAASSAVAGQLMTFRVFVIQK
ncbi:MAG TPA: hypothetical protein VIM71_07495 [Lacunisphaera sp.]